MKKKISGNTLSILFGLLIFGMIVWFKTPLVIVQYEEQPQGKKQEVQVVEKSPVKSEQELQEEADREKQAGIEYMAVRKKWLDENPPVREFFDEGRIYNTDYVIQYLKENKIGGHCALVWRIEVVCADFGGVIKFPTRTTPR